jgi:L-alanine-DL-glutamate epimerase-like enolase superfamily enzyme
MRITSIETFRREEKFAVVRVRTDDGLEGWGQTSAHFAGLTVDVLHTLVAPFFVGTDPWRWGAELERFTRQSHKQYGSLLWRAVSGVDTAVHDLLGKAVGQPVHAILGGALRERIPVYASSMRRDISPEQEAERFEELRARQGIRAFKIRIGEMMGRDTDPWPGRSLELIRIVRERLGDDAVIHADANGGYSPGEAIRIGRRLEEYGFHHFEEPCPWNELESTAHVAAVLDIPVAGGEQDVVLEQFHRMVTNRVVDIVQPDIGYIGGMRRAVKVTQMAEAAGIVATPHCANRTMIGLFTLHLAASQPAVSAYQEWSIERESWSEDVFWPPLEVADGHLTVSDAPGWGVEIVPDFLRSSDRRETNMR